MHRLHEDRGITFLFSTHDRMVMTRAGRLLLLRDGRIVADGPPGTVLDGG
jgi:putative ABC transport system ATP-binding protein